MNQSARYCAATSLVVLGLVLPALSAGRPAAVLAQDDPLPVNAINDTLVTAEHDAGPTQAEQAVLLRQELNQQAERFDQRLTGQARRIARLEQTLATLKTRLDRLQPSRQDNISSATATTGADKPAAAQSTLDGATDDAQPAASARDNEAAVQAYCTAALDDRFLFDVFFQASSAEDLASATAKVQAMGLNDWFASSHRLYVGRYGTCHLAKRRRADVHERTGLALTIDAVEPNPQATHNENDADVRAPMRQCDTAAATPSLRSAPFVIAGFELRGRQSYLGVASRTPHHLNDITWLQPGEAYGAWRLESIDSNSGSARFAVRGHSIAVKLPE